MAHETAHMAAPALAAFFCRGFFLIFPLETGWLVGWLVGLLGWVAWLDLLVGPSVLGRLS